MNLISAPALKGGSLALLAAVLFGLSTPLVQHFGLGLGAFTTAALLYAGAAMVALAMRQPPEREAALTRSDWPRIGAMAALGAVIGPVALAWGLQRTSGSSASLMLTLEALFTAVLAWRLYGETMDKRVGVAMLLLLAGGVALVLDQGLAGGPQLLGLLAVLVATAAWGIDNTLSRGVALRTRHPARRRARRRAFRGASSYDASCARTRAHRTRIRWHPDVERTRSRRTPTRSDDRAFTRARTLERPDTGA